MKSPRMSLQTFQVLQMFVADPAEWRYGYDLSRETGLKAGTLYPILMRLTEHSLLEAEWVTGDPGTLPRHMYRLTVAGLSFAKKKLAVSNAFQLSRPLPSGGRA